MTKHAFMIAIALISLNASAAKIVECLKSADSSGNFYKASITETSRKQLRGNFVIGPKSLMTYSSIDVRNEAPGVYSDEGPSTTLKAFKLELTSEAASEKVNNLEISGMKSKLSVVESFSSGETRKTQTDVICGSPLKIKTTGQK